MKPNSRPLVVFVDVDDTVVRSFGSKQIPMTASVENVRKLCSSPTVTAYCWSAGGADYAERVAREVGLEGVFAGYLPKPQVMIDDQPLSTWRELAVLHPNEAMSLDEAEFRRRLGWST